jgi:hypothetical protein
MTARTFVRQARFGWRLRPARRDLLRHAAPGHHPQEVMARRASRGEHDPINIHAAAAGPGPAAQLSGVRSAVSAAARSESAI